LVSVGQFDNGVLLLSQFVLEEAQADASWNESGLSTVLEKGSIGIAVQAAPLIAIERVHVLQALSAGKCGVERHAVLVELRELGVLLGHRDGGPQDGCQCEQMAVHSKQLVFNRFLAKRTQTGSANIPKLKQLAPANSIIQPSSLISCELVENTRLSSNEMAMSDGGGQN